MNKKNILKEYKKKINEYKIFNEAYYDKNNPIIKFPSVDLPEPVLPFIPMLFPFLIKKLKFLICGFLELKYEKLPFLNFISPVKLNLFFFSS